MDSFFWHQHQANDLTNGESFWPCYAHIRLQALWHQDVSAGSDQRLVDYKEREWGGSACSSPPFSMLHGNQCNFRGVTEQTAESRTPGCSPEHSGRGKIPWRNKQHPQTTCKKSSFVFVCSSHGCNSGFHKIYLLLCVVMICLSLFQGSVALFVHESSSVQRRLHTEPKRHDVMDFNK